MPVHQVYKKTIKFSLLQFKGGLAYLRLPWIFEILRTFFRKISKGSPRGPRRTKFPKEKCNEKCGRFNRETTLAVIQDGMPVGTKRV